MCDIYEALQTLQEKAATSGTIQAVKFKFWHFDSSITVTPITHSRMRENVVLTSKNWKIKQ